MGGYTCIQTVGSVFSQLNGAEKTQVETGLDTFGEEVYEGSYNAAITAASNAEQVVLALGIGNANKYETGDRAFINLPRKQESLAIEILAMGKSAVLVLINGGAVAIENVIPNADAVIEAFIPEGELEKHCIRLFSEKRIGLGSFHSRSMKVNLLTNKA